MKGKEKCKILKEIRAEIAKANDINWVTENCTHKGDCRGTCPKCESEVRALERELERRRMLGKTVVLAGISATMLVGTMGCDELLYDMNTSDGMMVEPDETTTRTKRTTTTAVDVFMGEPSLPILTEYYRCTNESTYVANRALYLEFVSDFEYSDDVYAYIAKDEVFTVIGYSTRECDYLVRRGDGVILSLYSISTEDITLLTPAPDFDGEGMTYGGVSYLVQDYIPVAEKTYKVSEAFDIMQLYNRAYTEEKKERLDADAFITLVGESEKNQTSLIRLEDGSLFVVDNRTLSEKANLFESPTQIR